MPARRVWIGGVPVDAVSVEETHEFVLRRLASRESAQIVTVNAEFVVRARHDARFRDVLTSAALATPDGAGILWALRRGGIRLRERVGGSDLIWTLSEVAAKHNYSVFLLGGRDGVARAAGARLQSTYPQLHIAGTHSGSPSPTDDDGIVDLIRRSSADILFVAYGAPAQELWISRNLRETGAACAIGVGGSFDYLAGEAKRAPPWMQRHSLEWLWRLVRQPWRWRRVLALPRFVILVLREGSNQGETERRDRERGISSSGND